MQGTRTEPGIIPRTVQVLTLTCSSHHGVAEDILLLGTFRQTKSIPTIPNLICYVLHGALQRRAV